MPHNDDPFNFDEKFIDPSGRVVRTVQGTTTTPAPKPRRRRAAEPVEPPTLEELLRASIREVTEREIRKAESESDLSELLRRMLEEPARRGRKAGNG